MTEPVVLYFGPAWRRKEWERQVDTPVGVPCLHCEEPVEQGDTGTFQAYMDVVDGVTSGAIRPLHYECQMRMVIGSVGHLQGTCSCQVPGSHEGDPEGMTLRQAAIAAVKVWSSQ